MEHALFDLPHTEAARLARSGAPVYLSVNPVEYHGPHLSLHNDRLVSLGLARDLHARLAVRHPERPLLLGADLEVGVEPAPGTGSRRTRFPVLRELVIEACRALADLGAQRVVLMTFHGAPLHSLALEAGVQWLRERGVRALNPFNVVMRELLERDDTSAFAEAVAHLEDPCERQAVLQGLALDFHAGFLETSLALHYAPASVSPSHRQLPSCPEVAPEPRLMLASRAAARAGQARLARELRFAALGLGWNQLRPFPGYTGRPQHATAASGAVFARFIVDRYSAAAEAVLERGEAPPAPIMAWLGRLSLHGRVGALPEVTRSELSFADGL